MGKSGQAETVLVLVLVLMLVLEVVVRGTVKLVMMVDWILLKFAQARRVPFLA